MIWSWIILIALSIGIIVWISISYKENDNSFGASIVCAFLLLLLGWLMIGCLNDVDEKIVKSNDNLEIIKTKYFILIIDGEEIFNFNTKKDFENISDTTSFYYLKGVNMYGFEAGYKKILYYTYEDIIQKMDTVKIVKNKVKNLGERL